MLTNFLSKSKPVNFVVLFLLFLCYTTSLFFTEKKNLSDYGSLVFVFVIIFSIYNFVVIKNKVTFDNSFAFLYYVILVGFIIQKIELNSIFYANLTILLFLRKVYSLQTLNKISHKLFDGGLWLAISFLIEPTTILFIVLLYISIFVNKQQNYQTLLIPILGFTAPVILYFTYSFWTDNINAFYNLWDVSTIFDIQVQKENSYIFTLGFVGVFTVLAILLKTPKTLSILNQFRKNWILVLCHFIISLIVALLVPNKTGAELLFVAFPVAIILANAMELFQKKWFADIFILLFVIASIANFFI